MFPFTWSFCVYKVKPLGQAFAKLKDKITPASKHGGGAQINFVRSEEALTGWAIYRFYTLPWSMHLVCMRSRCIELTTDSISQAREGTVAYLPKPTHILENFKSIKLILIIK